MKATIKALKRMSEDSNGNPYRSKKDGKPYTRLLIQIEEMEETLSGFDNDATKEWKEGTVANIEVEKKEVGGNTYWNFKLPNKFDLMEKRVLKLEKEVFKETSNEPDVSNLPF